MLFEQVLFNLLDNAAKYASNGYDDMVRNGREGRFLLLQDLDEGEGIPGRDLDHVFDKFYRVKKGDRVRAGTGLGLAISRGFVDAMHRSITARQSHRSHGRRVFSIRLPVPSGPESLGGRHEHSRPHRARHRRRATDPELLRMELATKATKSWKRRRKSRARTHGAAPERDHPGPGPSRHAGPRPSAHPPRPKRARCHRGTVEWDDESGKVEALDSGADDYVTKPFGMNELLARMRAALRHQLQVQGERPFLRAGDLSVDLVRRMSKISDREVKLSPKEYDLLRLLVQHAGKASPTSS